MNGMKFTSRLKKEMSEGIVRAILEHAGYRVTDYGIEKQIPALNCRTYSQYHTLALPYALRQHPDFLVIAADERSHQLVEVKYRREWRLDVLIDMQKQVEIMGEIVLVSLNATAPNPRNLKDMPSRFLRCCRLRYAEGHYEVELRERGKTGHTWHLVDSLSSSGGLWWRLSPLHEVFVQLRDEDSRGCLRSAVKAISGLLDTEPARQDLSSLPAGGDPR